MRPSVRQLEYLVAVADTLSFRRAAETCHITQPALSIQIQEVESLLGVRIFERDRRRVLVTTAGENIVARTRKALGHIDEIVDAARASSEPLRGNLKLGVIPTVAPYLLPEVLPAVRKRYPECRLLLVEDQTAHLVRRLGEGELDVVLLALEAELGAMQTLPLFQDEFVVVLPKTHPLARGKSIRESDLDGASVLLLEDGHCLRDQALDVCNTAGASEVGDFRAGGLSTLIQMVAHGIGITLLPTMAIKTELGRTKSLCARPFIRPKPCRTIALAWRPTSPRADEFSLLGAFFKKRGA